MKKMHKKDIFTAILAGGKGKRLWPKSRVRFPKQNLRLLGKRTIIQDTLERARKISSANLFIIINKESLPYTKNQLKKFESKRIVVEPFGRNTAPAIGLATLLAFRENSNAILVTMPSDHLIGNHDRFFNNINTAIKEANKQEVVVTLGMKPTSAESDYGYVGIDKKISHISQKSSYKVVKFIEKPHPPIARRLVSNGRFFWNSGIFIFKTSTMLSTLKKHMPALHKGLLMLPDMKDKHRFSRELKRLYEKLRSESLDCAILEKSKNVRVIPSDFEWSDVGSFESIARLVSKDKNGNSIFGSHLGIDTKRSVIFSDTGHLVGTIGIKDVIVVATPDAVLVCKRSRAGDIKKLVKRIRGKKRFSKFL